MTHDELLEEINWAIQEYDEAYDNTNYYYTALRAVVELHKPEIFHNGIENITVCEECNYEYSSDKENLYPCQTIKKIKEKLQ